MALFTDGLISSMDELAAYDSQLLDIASEEGINVTQKMALAQEQIGLDLVSMLASLKSADWPLWLVREPHLGQIVVTPALKVWHIYRSLEMVYSDAYYDQLNDRYGAKRDQFQQSAQMAREKLIQIGVGVVLNPIPQAITPQLIAITGSLPDATYYATMAWVNQAGQEGASAVPDAIATVSSAFEVQPVAAPAHAVGWNAYVGTAPDSMVIQNTTLIASNQAWQQLAAPATTGAAPGNGQKPQFFKPLPRVIRRG
jgi:hypothetical protein